MNTEQWGLTFYLIAIAIALLVGTSKAGVPGLGILAVPLTAMIFDSKTSVGILLPMLVIADIFAVFIYRKSAQWKKILQLFPSVGVGMITASIVYLYLPKEIFSPVLGFLILVMLVFDLLKKKYKWEKLPENVIYIFTVGFLAGFATTIGNAAGPIMGIYLLSCGLDKKEFMGTGAWYFLIINSLKVPFFIYAGSITLDSLYFNLKMVPIILIGIWLGSTIFTKLNQKVFQTVVLSLAFLSAIILCFK